MFDQVFENVEATDLIDKGLSNFIPFKSLTNEKKGGE
jgi:hypothetical protein